MNNKQNIERYYGTRPDWPKGPWDDEPDREYWVDEATGLPCLIRRGPLGSWCGYVGVSASHPFHGLAYQEVDEDRHKAFMTPHGGLTYSAPCDGDVEGGICHVPTAGEDDVWWFGFDCGHAFDYLPGMHTPRHDEMYAGIKIKFPDHEFKEHYWTIAEVKQEVTELAATLAAVT